MNQIRLVGQAITSTNYATTRLFNFNPEMVRDAALNFLAAGIPEVEIPEGVLDPEGRGGDKGVDEAAMRRTIELLPREARVTATYLGPGSLGTNDAAFLTDVKRKIDNLLRFFPHMMNAMLHPPGIKEVTPASVKGVVKTWAEAARYAASKRPGFQCCLHNHYDSSCETSAQVILFLEAIGEANEPALRWGPDTGHSHGMGTEYLKVFDKYAPLIGNHFHIKARVPAFDQRHGDKYQQERDIWGNKAEFGKGLYGGFVNCADPEIETPFKEVFAILRKKARPTAGVVTGAIEIDNPRQHPRLEAMCSALYMKQVHGLGGSANFSVEQIVAGAFGKA